MRKAPTLQQQRQQRDKLAAAAFARAAKLAITAPPVTHDPIVLINGRPVTVSAVRAQHGAATDPVQVAAKARASRAAAQHAQSGWARSVILEQQATERANHAREVAAARERAAVRRAKREGAADEWRERMEDAALDVAELRHHDRVEDSRRTWRRFQGATLEHLLRAKDRGEEADGEEAEQQEAPVRLVDARFLLRLAEMLASSEGKQRLPRRQEVPEDAFIDLPGLQGMTQSGFGSLRILCVSMPWFQPDHPDPRSDQFLHLCKAIRMFVRDTIFEVQPATYAVFLPFLSMHQNWPSDKFWIVGEERTALEHAAFTRALHGLGECFAHPHTVTLQLTTFPLDYPRAFGLALDPDVRQTVESVSYNTATCDRRPWCQFELEASRLVKAQHLLLDLGRFVPGKWRLLGEMLSGCQLRREPPVMPFAFTAKLDKLTGWSNRERDQALIATLYSETFLRTMARVLELDYSGCHWGRDEVPLICKVFASGALTYCERIDMRNNRFMPWDVEQIQRAIQEGVRRGVGFQPSFVLLGAQNARTNSINQVVNYDEVGGADAWAGQFDGQGDVVSARAQAANDMGKGAYLRAASSGVRVGK